MPVAGVLYNVDVESAKPIFVVDMPFPRAPLAFEMQVSHTRTHWDECPAPFHKPLTSYSEGSEGW